MFAICIESSHRRGLGHLFRAVNFIDCLKSNHEEAVVFVNDDKTAIKILEERGIKIETVDLRDHRSGWEAGLIVKYGVEIWVDDRLDTVDSHSRKIKDAGIKLVTLDDRGSGAELADINVASLPCSFGRGLKGMKVLESLDYLMLNREIANFKRLRKEGDRIIVTLGGSDTYGVTLKVVEILKGLDRKFTVHTGPAFEHRKELDAIIDKDVKVIRRVPSLIETLYDYDLAVTGGGMTPFEANAAGLPCIIVANETFEIPNGNFLEELGSSVFTGYHEDIDRSCFTNELDIEKMSAIGMEEIPLNGTQNVYNEMRAL